MPYGKGGMRPLVQARATEQPRLPPLHQAVGTRARLEDRAMQPAEVFVREHLRILRAPDAKGQGHSRHWQNLMNSRETDGKEEWTNKENRYPISARTNK